MMRRQDIRQNIHSIADEFYNEVSEKDEAQQKAIIIAFKDQGIGIPEEELKTVFNKFIQSSNTRTGAGGTGLGLAICKQIVDHHQGARIWAEQNPDGGTIFFLQLLPAQDFPKEHK